jgi:hypothetical protein
VQIMCYVMLCGMLSCGVVWLQIRQRLEQSTYRPFTPYLQNQHGRSCAKTNVPQAHLEPGHASNRACLNQASRTYQAPSHPHLMGGGVGWQCGVVWCGMVWCGMVWNGMVCGMLYGVVCCMVWYVLCHVVWRLTCSI